MNKFFVFNLLSGVLLFCSEFSFGNVQASEGMEAYTYESPQMGVPFRIVLYTDQAASHANHAASKAWERIAALNAILSNYETESELSRLGYASGQGVWSGHRRLRALPVICVCAHNPAG